MAASDCGYIIELKLISIAQPTKLLMQLSKGIIYVVKIHDTPITRETPATHHVDATNH